MDEFKAGLFPPAADTVYPEVTDLGQIALMKLPVGFVLGKQSNPDTSSSFFMEYHSSTDPDCKVYFEYRGRRMSQKTSDLFRDLIIGPTHNVTHAELEGLREMLKDKIDSECFRILVARTPAVRGKRVLVVEGVYIKHGLQARTFYVDADGTGSAVQEITFQAPVDRFGLYLLQGLKSLESIVWK